MKKRRQNDREMRVQDDNITESANARSPLTFRNLLFVVAYMQTKPKDTES